MNSAACSIKFIHNSLPHRRELLTNKNKIYSGNWRVMGGWKARVGTVHSVAGVVLEILIPIN